MTDLLKSASAVLVLGAALAGCASLPSAPMSVLNGNPPNIKIDGRLAPLRILSVDGRLFHSNPVQVGPGLHSLVLTSGGGSNPNRQVRMLIEPCTRYYLAARRETVTAMTWEMTIVSSESVGGCDPAEERRKAGI
jgi:hypothetical protein